MFEYVGSDPLNEVDMLGLKVLVCAGPNELGVPDDFLHYWLMTDTQEAGMGKLSGLSTTWVDHAGRSLQPGSRCTLVPDIDEECINRILTSGETLGPFLPPVNYCYTAAQNALDRCVRTDLSDPMSGGAGASL